MTSLRHLLLCDEDNFQSFTGLIQKYEMLPGLKCDQNLSFDMVMEIRHMSRKVKQSIEQSPLQQPTEASSLSAPVEGKPLKFLDMLSWLKFESSLFHEDGERHINIPILPEPYILQNFPLFMNSARRRLLEESSNLLAAPVIGFPPQDALEVLSTESGAFPAVPNANSGQSSDGLSKDPTRGSDSTSNDGVDSPISATSEDSDTSDRQGNKLLIIILPAAAILFTLIGGIVMWHRQQGPSSIGPRKTGLSGPLQKAFVTGVPKLNHSELEVACEDFSNIIRTHKNCTEFKGTLSSGVEISVVSTAIASEDWSRRADSYFRKKVEELSRINHKNFINLLGYCEEKHPFMRMMAFEYAPNGTLFEHLHAKEFEHLDWDARMRIIMGTAYCLQYIHHELNPPVTLGDLNSSSVHMTEDYAAKVCESQLWAELADRRIKPEGEDMDPSASSTVNPASNVYSFGLLMLEIISGKLPHTEEEGSILNWATEYLSDKHNIINLVDPSLKTFKDEELEVVCEAIQECIHGDNENRPSIQDVVAKLVNVLGISPGAASPRLCPLWWAELELLSLKSL